MTFGRELSVIVVALLAAAIVPVARRFPAIARFARAGGDLTTALVPRALAFTTFLGGVILLFSGATPARAGRLGWVNDVLPLPVVEISSYFVSVAGVALVLLARGLQRRLDAAYHLTLWVLAGGILFELASALDVEQAVLLTVTFVALRRSHRYFHRRSSLFDERFTRGWYLAIAGVLVATAVLGYLGYGRQLLSTRTFWEFEENSQAPRAMRALTLAVIALLALSLARLLRPSRVRSALAPVDAATTERIVRESPRASAHLALLGDKEILLAESGNALLMTGRAGQSHIVMGDPVGPTADAAALVDRFVRQCHAEDLWPVFYRVGPQLLYLYLEYGLSVVKLGEVARVPLAGFSLDGAQRRNLRRVWRKLAEGGCSFELVPRERVPELLPALRRISNEWLGAKQAREKGFSLGRFDDAFVARGPVGIVRAGGRVVAFATLWLSGQHAEVEVDLMRHLSGAPPGVMRYLLTECMLWAKQEGYAFFNLGMVPLSGIRAGTVSPLWNQMANAVRVGGERYYNFQGLREFKAWFHPEWEPSYLVSPGGTKRARIVANVAALVSGGAKGLFAK